MHDTSYYVKSEAEMLALFHDLPEAVTNTQLVADQCNLDLEFGRLHLPEPAIPPGVTAHDHLTNLAREGLNRRYPFADEAVRARLQYELDVVEKTGFTNYFHVVHDIAQFCKRAGKAIFMLMSGMGRPPWKLPLRWMRQVTSCSYYGTSVTA